LFSRRAYWILYKTKEENSVQQEKAAASAPPGYTKSKRKGALMSIAKVQTDKQAFQPAGETRNTVNGIVMSAA